MNSNWINVLLSCISIALGIASGMRRVDSYAGYQVWRVVPSSNDQLKKLVNIGQEAELDFWREPSTAGSPATFMVRPDQQSLLDTKMNDIGLEDYKIDLRDIQDVIAEQMEANANVRKVSRSAQLSVSTFDYSVYHPPSEVYEWMDMMVQEFNETAMKHQIGVTYEGRPVYALTFKRASTQARPKIFIDALIHCREWITTASVLFMLKEMLTNPKYSHMMEDVDWYFVPMLNVDGYQETWTGDRLWRKTRSTGPSAECVGTDGNRNWDGFWSIVPGSSSDPCSLIYHGPTPASESEVRNLANYVRSFGDGYFDAYISTHSAAQMILYPYIYTENEISKDDQALHEAAKLMSEAVRAVHGKEYVYGRGSTTIYPASATTTDWTYEVAKIVQSHTYELRDTGEYGFLLPPEQIIPNGEEYLEGIRALKDYVLQNFSG